MVRAGAAAVVVVVVATVATVAVAAAVADGYCSSEILDYVVANGDEWNCVVNKAKYVVVEETLQKKKRKKNERERNPNFIKR